MSGRLNGSYELRDLLGEGSFGEVYLAVDRQLSEEEHEALVSIKILSGRGRSDWSRRQLTDEATKARRIDHPNVVRVLDRGVSEENEDFIVYEFVDGGELNQWSRRNKKPLPVREAVPGSVLLTPQYLSHPIAYSATTGSGYRNTSSSMVDGMAI